MVLSKACTYGILASLYVAREANRSKDYVSIGQMSKELNISFHFLTKILQQLTSAGILTSMKGPKGGVALKRNPKEISLVDIVVAIDGMGLFTDCLLGLPGCGEEKPCPVHDEWAGIRANLFHTFRDKSLADTAQRIDELNLRFALPTGVQVVSGNGTTH
jgi:Rrf2 family transcriptional regulator, iron-sulfur cluster assembly transcription factor